MFFQMVAGAPALVDNPSTRGFNIKKGSHRASERCHVQKICAVQRSGCGNFRGAGQWNKPGVLLFGLVLLLVQAERTGLPCARRHARMRRLPATN
jgi:hypothetical protein